MKPHETEKFEKYGSFLWKELAICILAVPLLLGLIISLVSGHFSVANIFVVASSMAILVIFILAMMLGYGDFNSVFVKRTAKQIMALPYHFNSSFKGRGGMLYIDVEEGMIAFISTYNPLKLQVFNATRMDGAESIASASTGIRFVFWLDGKKVTMPTLITNRYVSTTSGIGAEAVSKADTFTELLLAAKRRAEEIEIG